MSNETKFTRPPSGSELDDAGIKSIVSGDSAEGPSIEDVAEALGGKVDGVANRESDVESDEVPVKEPEVDGVPVDLEDRKEYLRTLLAGEPFKKTYTLFGGPLVVVFKTRTTSENDQVDIELQHNEAAKSLIDVKGYGVARERMRMAFSCLQLQIGGEDIEPSLGGFSEMDETAFAAVRGAFRNFEDTCDVMFARANDPDFWKEIGGTT